MTVIPVPAMAPNAASKDFQPSEEQLQDRARRFGVQSKPAEPQQPRRKDQPFTAGINLLEQVPGMYQGVGFAELSGSFPSTCTVSRQRWSGGSRGRSAFIPRGRA